MGNASGPKGSSGGRGHPSCERENCERLRPVVLLKRRKVSAGEHQQRPDGHQGLRLRHQGRRAERPPGTD